MNLHSPPPERGKKLGLLLGASLGAAVLLWLNSLPPQENFPEPRGTPVTPGVEAQSNPADQAGSPPQQATTPHRPLAERLSVEAGRLNETLDPNPEETEARMRKIAESLTESDLAFLSARAAQTDAPASERMLAAHWLSLSSLPGATAPLQTLLESPLPDPKAPSAHGEDPESLEWGLKAHALEGWVASVIRLPKGERTQWLNRLEPLSFLAERWGSPWTMKLERARVAVAREDAGLLVRIDQESFQNTGGEAGP